MLAPNPAYFTANDLRNWAMTRSGEYEYGHPCGCAIYHFMAERGAPNPIIGATYFYVGGEKSDMPHAINEAVRVLPHTFEALAERLTEIA